MQLAPFPPPLLRGHHLRSLEVKTWDLVYPSTQRTSPTQTVVDMLDGARVLVMVHVPTRAQPGGTSKSQGWESEGPVGCSAFSNDWIFILILVQNTFSRDVNVLLLLRHTPANINKDRKRSTTHCVWPMRDHVIWGTRDVRGRVYLERQRYAPRLGEIISYAEL